MAVVREVRACPACGGERFETVGSTVAASYASSGSHAFGQPAFSIRSCTDCGLYFKSHTLTLRELEEYSAHREFNAYEVDDNFPTDRILQHVLRRLPAGRKVLDFGCSTGRILRGLTAHLECYGIEVNEAAAAIARARGIRLITEERLRVGEKCEFDVIILADVYEHLPQPLELLVRLFSALKSGGRLAVITGNADAIRTRDRMAEYWWHWTAGTFANDGRKTRPMACGSARDLNRGAASLQSLRHTNAPPDEAALAVLRIS